jgi:hypothetical protein
MSLKGDLAAALEDWRTNEGQHGCTPEKVADAIEALVNDKIKHISIAETSPTTGDTTTTKSA